MSDKTSGGKRRARDVGSVSIVFFEGFSVFFRVAGCFQAFVGVFKPSFEAYSSLVVIDVTRPATISIPTPLANGFKEFT
jgi:hypothetical protein